MKQYLIFFFFTISMVSFAGPKDSIPGNGYRKLGFLMNVGTIYAHSADVENTKGSLPVGFEIEYSKRLLGLDIWSKYQCYPTQGFVLGFTNYDNHVLGQGAHLGYFLEYPFLPLSRVTPFIRGTAGLSYGNKPWHPEKNPQNESYSFPLNVFAQVQIGLEALVSKNSLLTARLGFSHNSNGGLKLPNKGINWLSMNIGLLHAFDYYLPEKGPRRPLDPSAKRWMKRTEVYASFRGAEYDLNELLWTYGSMFSLARKVSRIHAFSAAIEWHYSERMEMEIKKHQSSASPHRVACLAGHDFLLGRFIFSQQLGIYLLDQFRFYSLFYHRWGLNYVHKSGVSAGISLKAHKHVAEFTDFRIGYHW